MDGKICQNKKFKHLGKIRLHMIFTVLVNNLKAFFEQTKI